MNDADALPIVAVRERPTLHTLGTYLHLPRIWYTVPEGLMQNSKAEKLRKLASKRQIVRAKDARELGIPRTYLPRLARRGDLEKVGRGLYSSRDFSGTENTSLIEAAYQIPKGIVCLLSALRFHNFTTQSPHEVWMAIGHKAWAPKVSSPPVRILRMSGPALHFGLKEYSISGATLRVFPRQRRWPTASSFAARLASMSPSKPSRNAGGGRKPRLTNSLPPPKSAASPTSCARIWSHSS